MRDNVFMNYIVPTGDVRSERTVLTFTDGGEHRSDFLSDFSRAYFSPFGMMKQ